MPTMKVFDCYPLPSPPPVPPPPKEISWMIPLLIILMRDHTGSTLPPTPVGWQSHWRSSQAARPVRPPSLAAEQRCTACGECSSA